MSLLEELRYVAGAGNVLSDPDVCAPYEVDWTGRFGAGARAVVRPGSTQEVAGVLRACARHDVAVVPQGGNTGLVGGGVPRGDEVVLSLTRMRDIGPVDLALGHVTADAGATLADLQERAEAVGMDAGLDFAARDSATIGGVVACDAGGARALRHGTARARVAGLEAVLADGSVVRRLGGLTKDNAGYALPALVVGSEGTLAVITRVVWRLVPLLAARVVTLVGLPDATAAAGLLASLRVEAPSLEACELMTDAGMELVLRHQRRDRAVPRAPTYVLAELAGSHDPTDELAAALQHAGIDDAAIADDTTSRKRMWLLREGHTDAIAAAGLPHKLDVGVPLAALPAFLAALDGAVAAAAPDVRTIVFGHLGDGNLHVNLLGLAPGPHPADDAVLQLVLEHGGTISAEHGVGTAKAGWLEAARGAEEVAAMRRIKTALDESGLLNPGVVVSR